MRYLHKKLQDYLSIFIRPQDSLVEIDSFIEMPELCKIGGQRHAHTLNPISGKRIEDIEIQAIKSFKPDYLLINGCVHYWQDIQKELGHLFLQCSKNTRLIIVYYSILWKPLLYLASLMGMRKRLPEMNWLSPHDVETLCRLAGFESIRDDKRVLLPVHIPKLSDFINRYIAPLPPFSYFCLCHLRVLRPCIPRWNKENRPSVSIVIPARNEAGNIEAAIQRVPSMGPNDEVIFIEGNSTDNTWDIIQQSAKKYNSESHMRIKFAQQDGKGKGDAVRKGFALAENDILMILDADLTVPPEELPKFYDAIVSDHGEYINGSRLVYPMEKKAMRFFNIIGNKTFSILFSFVLGQIYKDTLCGTKVLSREHYKKLSLHRDFFGNFDPFGDFDLIFGTARMGLKTVEVPIRYRERKYGTTNIDRWRHGIILFKMLFFAAGKIRFI